MRKKKFRTNRKEILETIEQNQVVIISGETGSGKSTQIAQFIFNLFAEQGKDCGIICTQPRRISAISIAERVAVEQAEKIGKRIEWRLGIQERKRIYWLLN